MAFTGNEGDIIYQATAEPMTRAYREQKGTEFKAQFFGKNQLKQIIDDAGSEYVGIRIYNALDDAGNQSFVLVAVKADENDLYENKMLANGPACPPCCAPDSPLNE
ncbi:hypothetical protein [Hymenobacter cellulosilyticus]|uniref:Uncharacterized protein n=1 Tax=Hymenobacter cellulosilyticus TaxID=2932248 RepID=A0A8T9QAP6_9BACT|nr:hypothetical protein [Hymenobacter cellulosilyticus]UOQ74577.1 hypothetical protein MUN79_12300 [Hymenobacter cellulosilyticus]